MKLTIVVDDNAVGVDGVFRKVQLPAMGATRAVQWGGVKGVVEYSDGRSNSAIDTIAGYADIVQLWNALTPPAPIPPTLAQLKSAKIEAIKTERDRLIIQGGHKIGLFWYHSNEISLIQQIALNSLADKMVAGGAPDGTAIISTPWKTLSGEFVTLTVGIGKSFIQSALTQQGALFTAAQNKINEINALTTIAQVEGYAEKAGFPAVYSA